MNDQPNQKEKILIVEDEQSLAIGLEFNLQQEGYEVALAKDGREALNSVAQNNFDLIILDIMLPFFDGFEITQNIREHNKQIPILILTAKTKFEDKLKGLELGADDYLTKPFHLEEFLLRVKGILKRKSWYKAINDDQPVYSFGSNKVNFWTFSCTNQKGTFSITKCEAMVLKYLIENKGKVVSRKELLENVWNVNPDIETRTVDIFISHLRKYFERDPSQPLHIKSVRSIGYIFHD